jgi:hypothetical protein
MLMNKLFLIIFYHLALSAMSAPFSMLFFPPKASGIFPENQHVEDGIEENIPQ